MSVHPSPLLSAVVPCRDERDHIGRCLDSILATDYPAERLEVLVADGRSGDGTREIVERYAARHSAIRLVDNPERIVPTGLNRAIRAARGEIIVRLDAHVVYPPTYLTTLVQALLAHGADNVGGVIVMVPADESPLARAIAAALSIRFGVGNSYFRIGTRKPRWVDTVPFGCFRRDVFERVGLFDEDLARNQDDEFNCRLIRSGGRVLLVPDATASYVTRRSLRQLWRMYYQYGYFKPLVARKIGTVMTARQLAPGLFLAALGIAAPLAAWLNPARLVFGVLAAGYLVADLAVAAVIARRSGWRVGLAATAVFPVLHCAYGLGYLVGVFDFLVRDKRPNPAVSLSR
jgi:GT2 family glycosyltransferase